MLDMVISQPVHLFEVSDGGETSDLVEMNHYAAGSKGLYLCSSVRWSTAIAGCFSGTVSTGEFAQAEREESAGKQLV